MCLSNKGVIERRPQIVLTVEILQIFKQKKPKVMSGKLTYLLLERDFIESRDSRPRNKLEFPDML